MLDWQISLESVARVAFWSVVVGVFFTFGAALAGWRPARKPAAS